MEFCPQHEHHTETIEGNSKDIAGIHAKDSTVKWGIGIFLTLFIAASSIATTVVSSKIDSIAAELKEIKTAVHAIALDQVQFKAEMDSVKWRLDRLEAKK